MADRRRDMRDGDYSRRREEGRANTSRSEGRSSRTRSQGRGSSRPGERSHRGSSSSRTSRSSREAGSSRSARDARGARGVRDERSPRGAASSQSTLSSIIGTVGAVGGSIGRAVGGAAERINASHTAERVNSNRPFVLLLIFAAIAAVFFLRLGYLQVIESAHYSAMAEEARTISFTTTPHRGTIYDRNGTVLAKSVDATTIYANPAEVTDAAAEAQAIANVLGGDASTYRELLSKESTTFVYVKRQADVDAAAEVKKLALDGVYFIADTRREYPCGQIGGQVIGYCNVDGEGITGLELQYNDILSGTPGTYTAERGENGLPIPGGVKEETPTVDGQDIMISIDIELQEYVENLSLIHI